ncbi:MAG: hypothetical protein O2894_14100 [Planctomycetota bacterium]|nr:hypothetical protein [Planctomycetota bacterium]
MLVAHNELGHEPVEETDYDGKTVRRCPLYPGMTCREHVDAAVDIESRRDEALVPVPFIELCPNSWLVPPTGAPLRITEEDQFVPAKIRKQVEALQKTLGPALSTEVFGQVRNALAQAEAATDEGAFDKALRALAGVEGHVKKPHASLQELIAARLAAVEEPVGWAVEELTDGKEPEVERVAGMRALLERVDVAVYGRRLAAVAAIKAWLAERK